MLIRHTLLAAAVFTAVLAGCNKRDEAPATPAATTPADPAPAAAAPATPTPAPAATDSSAPAAGAPATSAAPPVTAPAGDTTGTTGDKKP